MAPASYDAPVLPDGRRLGAHLPLATGMVKAVERAHEIGATALQVFGDNPTAWRRRAEPPTELPAFRERLAALDIGPVAIHAAYLINLAGPEPRLPRAVGRAARRASCGGARVRARVRERPHRLASRHLGRGGHRRASAERSARVLGRRSTTRPRPPRLVLENSAGERLRPRDERRRSSRTSPRRSPRAASPSGGSASASTQRTPGAPASTCRPRTASTPSSRAFDDRIGLDRLVMVHLNDSKSERGSRTRPPRASRGRADRRRRGCARVLTHPALARTHVLPRDARAWTRATTRSTWRGRTTSRRADRSPTLPPEAMTLRGSRRADGAGRARRPTAAVAR